MRDAFDWLERYCSPETSEGPKRPCGLFLLPEELEPGDVMADGSILCQEGAVCWAHPHLWLTVPQARNASYYGWRVHDEFGSPRGADQMGRTLILVSRA